MVELREVAKDVPGLVEAVRRERAEVVELLNGARLRRDMSAQVEKADVS